MKTREQSLIAHIPIKWGGYALIQLDTVNVHAGTLPFSDPATLGQYGKIQALDPLRTASAGAPTQEDSGVALALGYENERLRVDIGTTPLGFAVHRVVGGLKLRHSFDAVYASLDLSKRPVTSSLVSYAGARDPVTGEVWGGVSSSGANVRVGYDRGRFSAYSSLGYHLLTGKNVLDNSQLAWIGLLFQLKTCASMSDWFTPIGATKKIYAITRLATAVITARNPTNRCQFPRAGRVARGAGLIC